MVSQQKLRMGNNRSCIRELFEFGRQRAAVVGRENVYDFSLGNPSVPAPDEVNAAIRKLIDELEPMQVHGYTTAAGLDEVRRVIAQDLNDRFGTAFSAKNLFITSGAAPALCSVCSALTIDASSEFIAIAPFFPEYTLFTTTAGARFTSIPADIAQFQINFDLLEAAISRDTQGVVINSPNNPSGVVYTEQTIQRLAALLERKSEEYGKPIYLISDEPYRELIYDGIPYPFVTKYYKNAIVCYSYSKCLSLPGERIGYVLVPDETQDSADVMFAVAGAARAMGHVCAPSLMQHMLTRCASVRPDLEPYVKNRDLLYSELSRMGYRCAKPSGAFYLFMQAPNGDGDAFSEAAKAYDLLIVPGRDFGCPGYVRMCYAVSEQTIRGALPAFEKLWAQFGK